MFTYSNNIKLLVNLIYCIITSASIQDYVSRPINNRRTISLNWKLYINLHEILGKLERTALIKNGIF